MRAAGGPIPATAAVTAPAAQVPLRRNRNFRLLWVGDALSDFGTNASELAFPLLVLLLTDSPALAGVVGTAAAVAALVSTLPAGALADRWNRRRVMLLTNGVRAVALGALAAAVLVGVATWPMVLAAAVVTSAASGLFYAAHTGLVAEVVPPEQLQPAFAANEARTYGAGLVGPPAGGALFGFAPAAPFVADAVSYVCSFVAVRLIRGHAEPAPATGEKPMPIRQAVAEGIKFVARSPLLRALAIQAPLVNLAFSGLLFSMILGLREGGAAPAVIGFALASIGVGGILGSLLAVRTTRMSLWTTLVLITLAGAALTVTAALILPSPAAALPLALLVLLIPRVNSAIMARLIGSTPANLHGRVSSAVGVSSGLLGALAPLAAGLLVSRFGGALAMTAFAAIFALAAVHVAASRAIRSAEKN
jgi:MFS family permease